MYHLQSHASPGPDQTYCVSQHEPFPTLSKQEARLTLKKQLNIYSVFILFTTSANYIHLKSFLLQIVLGDKIEAG